MELTKFQLAAIKRTAQNVNPMVSKKKKLAERIVALQEEYAELDALQQQYEAPIIAMTGFTTEDLIEKIKDEKGFTQYVFKYPSTIVPSSDEVLDTVDGDSYTESLEASPVETSTYTDEEAPMVEVPQGEDIFNIL